MKTFVVLCDVLRVILKHPLMAVSICLVIAVPLAITSSVVSNLNETGTYTPEPTVNGTDSYASTVCDSGQPQPCDTAPALAFPGAEGFGAHATGGRGGQIIEVTNLNDRGPGSLRAALLATGPRIVVFRTGGEIVLESAIRLHAEHSHLTIAGQTAPGDGITLRNRYGPGMGEKAPLVLDQDVENVVIRYLRSRPGPSYAPSDNVRGISIWGRNIIVDHCSFSWSTDEVINLWYTAQDITIQWNIISEGLALSTHLDTLTTGMRHSRGPLFGGNSTNISFHHNLMAHMETRGPRVKNGEVDIVNNVMYNFQYTPSYLDNEQNQTRTAYNYVGNFIKPGPDSQRRFELRLRDHSGASEPLVRAYLRGNIGENRPDDSLPEDLIVDGESKKFVVQNRHDFPPVTTTSAVEAYQQVLAHAGVTVPKRDVVDERIISEVINRTGRIINHPDEVGGWPALEAGTPPVDSDYDGMPDAWETLHGFNPNDPSDGPQDADGNGYTNVEEYLNELANNKAE